MAANETNLADQVAQMQSQLAFQEDTVASLDAALAAQQQEILVLREQVQWLRERQREFELRDEQAPGAVVDEKPPHY